MKQQIKDLAKTLHPSIIDIRRHIHAHPELSFKEYNTAAFIADKLKNWGVEYEHGVADTGVVALVKGNNPDKKTIALRADIDALPITEANEVAYKSTNEGVMHACGHDAHTASLLGVVKILHELKTHFEGTVKCIFQPGEEKAPGGASLMIEAGVLENPAPISILGQHVHPPLEVGKVAFRPGLAMASADEIYITVYGKGGHAAGPQFFVDPIYISSQIITALQQVVSRRANPVIPSVLSFGKINSIGGANNVIPNAVRIEGTFRTVDEKWRFEAHEKIRNIVNGLADSMDGRAEIEILVGYPVLLNDEELTNRQKQAAIDFLGEENVEDLPLRMGAEDFAFYTHHLPACFYRLGIRNESQNITSGLHTNTFNIDEKALETGMGLMAYLAVQELAL